MSVALVPALALSFPTLIDTGGNTGSQSATLAVRNIASERIHGRGHLESAVQGVCDNVTIFVLKL